MNRVRNLVAVLVLGGFLGLAAGCGGASSAKPDMMKDDKMKGEGMKDDKMKGEMMKGEGMKDDKMKGDMMKDDKMKTDKK